MPLDVLLFCNKLNITIIILFGFYRTIWQICKTTFRMSTCRTSERTRAPVPRWHWDSHPPQWEHRDSTGCCTSPLAPAVCLVSPPPSAPSTVQGSRRYATPPSTGDWSPFSLEPVDQTLRISSHTWRLSLFHCLLTLQWGSFGSKLAFT